MTDSNHADLDEIWPTCAAGCTGDMRCRCAEPIATQLKKLHAAQLDMCKGLESVADSLPEGTDSQAILSLSRKIFPTVKQAHEFEEQRLFTLLEHKLGNGDELARNIERLQFEHLEDESYAEEVADSLRGYVTDPQSQNPDALSYMLRGFFEGVRRHIAFEVEHIMPMLSRI